VTVIFFFAPIVMTTFSAIFLNERVGKFRWFAVILGFIGVVIAIQPGTAGFDWKFILPLAASITYATRAVLVRRLAGIETATQIVFHTRLGVGLLTVVPLLVYWQPMTQLDFGILIGMSLIQLAAHIFITKATVTASLTVVGPFEYTGLIWVALIGYIFWSEIPGNNIWIGAFFIIGAGLIVAYREALSRQDRNKSHSSPH
jgi:drug/metabolite transporter (DMT)-like permease